jgi:DNA-binding response OmpR family regulator
MATKRILVFESEQEFAQSIVSMFSDFDVDLKIIPDGKASDVDKDDPPDLILLCVELPNQSGYSICQKLKKDKDLKSIPLVIMSSEATEDTFESHKKLKTRADDYLIKPFGAEQLLEKVKALVALDEKEVLEEEAELISLDDQGEILAIEPEESLNVEDVDSLGDVEEELVSLDEGGDGEAGTEITDSTSEQEDGMEKFDDVFEGLQMDKDDASAPAEKKEAEPPAEATADDELANIDDVLGSLDSAGGSAAGSKKTPKEDSELGLESLDHLLGEEPKAEDDADALPQEKPSELDNKSPSDLQDLADLSEDGSGDLGLGLEEEKSKGLGSGLDSELGILEPDMESDLGVRADLTQEKDIGAPPSVPLASSRESSKASPAKPGPGMGSTPDPLLLTKIQNMEEENKILREKASKLQTQLEEMHQTFERRENELGSLRNKTSSKDKEYLSLKTSINAKDREILDLKEELNQKEQENIETQEKIGERDVEIARLEETLAKRDREIKELSERSETLLREKNAIQETHQAKMAEWEERYSRETSELEHKLQMSEEKHTRASAESDRKLESAKAETAKVRSEMEETKQRHGDEVYGLRTRFKNEVDKLEGDLKETKQQLQQTKQRLDQECANHEMTRQESAKVAPLESELERARGTIETLREQISDLEKDISAYEERVLKAYQKIKSDEKIKEKARKAVEIAVTLLSDQVAQEDQVEEVESPDEART